MTTFLESQIVERFRGSQLVKPAVRVCADANITLSGEQTIQSVSLLDGDSVGLKGQTDPKQNGIWTAHAGGWTRREDADELGDLQPGTMVYVEDGTFAGALLVLTTEAPIYPGQTEQTWIVYNVATSLGLGADKAVTTSGAGALQGTTISNDQVLARAGGIFLGVAYGPAVVAGKIATWDAGGVLRATVLAIGASPATSGDLRLSATSGVKFDAANRDMIRGNATHVIVGDIAARRGRVEGTAIELEADGAGSLTLEDDQSATLTTQGLLTLESAAGDLLAKAAAADGVATLQAGASSNIAQMICDGDSTTRTATIKVDGVGVLTAVAATLTVGVAAMQFGRSVAAPVLSQGAKTADELPQRLRVQAQDADPVNSTGANKIGGALELGGGRGKAAGTDLAGPTRINLGVLDGSGDSALFAIQSGAFGAGTTFFSVQRQTEGTVVRADTGDLVVDVGDDALIMKFGSVEAFRFDDGPGLTRTNASGSTVSDRCSARVTLTGATTVDLLTFTLADNERIKLRLMLIGGRTDSGNDVIGAEIAVTFKCDGTTVAQVGSGGGSSDQDAAITIAWNVATASTLKLQATNGRSGETWKIEVDGHHMRAVIT